MPFDGVTAPVAPATLVETVQRLGITPIPNDVLRAHKENEVRKHPGSWWYHHTVLTVLGSTLLMQGFFLSLFSSMLCWSGVALSLCSNPGNSLGFGFAGLVTGYICIRIIRSDALTMKGLRVKGPATWTEYDLTELGPHATVRGNAILKTFNVPASLCAIMWQIKTMVPGLYVVIGELQQQEVALDPYILLRNHQGEEIVIGIWDDTGMLYEADAP